MHEIINEPVDIIASFQGTQVIPKKMNWGDRIYNIDKVHLVHTAREGTKRVFYFSVSDSEHAFKLRFDTDHLEWSLAEVYTDG
jgi:hypothetical protein